MATRRLGEPSHARWSERRRSAHGTRGPSAGSPSPPPRSLRSWCWRWHSPKAAGSRSRRRSSGPALGGVVLIGLLLPQGPLTPRGRRAVRVGAALYALALIGSFALHTPVGGNSARLGALLAGPLLAGVLWDRHRLILCCSRPCCCTGRSRRRSTTRSRSPATPRCTRPTTPPCAPSCAASLTAGARSWRCR